MHLSIILGVYIHRATNQPTNQPTNQSGSLIFLSYSKMGIWELFSVVLYI